MKYLTIELALIAWSVILFAISLLSEKIRKSYFSIVSIFMNKVVGITILSFFGYISLITVLFYTVGFWGSEFLKNTILWTFFVGLILVWKFADGREAQKLFKTVLINSISVIIILEFIIGLYVYSFWWEFTIIGFVSFLVLYEAILSTKNDLHITRNRVGHMVSIIGLFILFFALYAAFSDLERLMTLVNFKLLVYPILLTIFSLPFFYLFILILKYEETFNRLKSSSANETVKRKAKFLIFKHCLFSFKKIKSANNMSIYNLYKLSDNADLNKLKKAYQEQIN